VKYAKIRNNLELSQVEKQLHDLMKILHRSNDEYKLIHQLEQKILEYKFRDISKKDRKFLRIHRLKDRNKYYLHSRHSLIS